MVRKGFFNRPSGRPSQKEAPPAHPSGASQAAAAAPVPSTRKPSEAPTDSAESRAKEQALRDEVTHLKKKLLEQENEARQGLVRKLSEQESKFSSDRRHWCESLELVAAEVQHCLGKLDSGGASASTARARELRVQASVQQVQESIQAGKTWVEKEQQRQTDFHTEVLTLQEMTSRELRERQDASQQQCTELRDLAKSIADLRTATKAVGDYVRFQSAGEQENMEPDLQQMAERVADFHALPREAKMAAMLDDGAVLRLMVMTSVLGMLFMLALLVEAFSARSCRFVCAR
ncbi:unnamed protein product [Polarella glacialis]|uniref:Uncharacterized protein n=1 Tax=Polarella glacialis TaxID=89957 RepID=A0A813KXG5_POLGL|nr:unnamed protein product [Polarella glacialis]